MKRVKISHNHPAIDFAPGVLNIVSRIANKEYYKPETFHSSPFYDQIVPVFAYDIKNSVNLLEIYGIDGAILNKSGIILINNHPIRKVKLVGLVLDYRIKTIRNEEYYILDIDDSSGVMINAKIKSKELISGFEGKYIEIVGIPNKIFDRFEITILNYRLNDEFYKQINQFKFWSICFKFRKLLQIPWLQSEQINNDPIIVQNIHQLNRKRLQLQTQFQNLNGIDEEDFQTLILDSKVYTKNRIKYDDVTDSLFNDIYEIIKEEESSSSIESNWIGIGFDIKSIVPLTTRQEILLILFKWIIRYRKLNFTIDELLSYNKISFKLEQLINEEQNEEIIDLVSDDDDNNNTIGSIQTLQTLKVTHLNSIFESISIITLNDTEQLLNLFEYLEKILFKLPNENSRLKFKSLLFLNHYNNHIDTQQSSSVIELDQTLLNHLIYWYLSKEGDLNWKYNEQLEWWYDNGSSEIINLD
ncbi:hypothetical protein WICMUC_005520 [Wickerhamomyces mucosus]|uniref:CST complex subunit Stn1 N-terminal domain-containing protein n=1 Tax=Wickerhamomyces mucosus TaxID=1378264 RepID=A0A9P8P6X5_9ASCO|nr:hypothetical protein WICMUC_005520 [Wickerhamomyces mucosus]